MKTMQPTRKDTSEPAVNSSRPVSEAGARRGMSAGLVAAMVVLGLAAGLFVGFLLWGTGGDSTDPIVAGGGELTARQEQMVEMFDDYVAKWQAGDADAIEAMFTSNGRINFLGTEYRVDDGTLIGYVERNPFPTLNMLEPVLIQGDTILSHHRLGGGAYEDIIQFTTWGDVAIVSHLIP